MKLEFAAFIILLLANCTSSLKENAVKEYKTKYTTAIILNARKTATLNGEVTIIIPYGTAVNVKKTDIKSVYDGKEDYWYYTEELDSYLFGLYLSDNMPVDSKSYTIYKNNNNEACPGDSYMITLNNMKAKCLHDEDCHGQLSKSEIEGSYKVFSNHIEISWKEYYTINSSIYNKKIEKVLGKAFTEKLYWNPKAKGWLSEDVFKEIQKHDCVYLTDDCTIDCSESCEVLKNKSGCKKYKDWYEYDFMIFPIYCSKNK